MENRKRNRIKQNEFNLKGIFSKKKEKKYLNLKVVSFDVNSGKVSKLKIHQVI